MWHWPFSRAQRLNLLGVFVAGRVTQLQIRKQLWVWVLLYSKRNIARLGVGDSWVLALAFLHPLRLPQAVLFLDSFLHPSSCLSWCTAITAGTVTECYVVMGTSCLPFCLPSSQAYELINGQGYFYPSFYPQYPTHACYTAPCSSFLDMQLPSLQSRDNNIHPIIRSKLVFGDQIGGQNWGVFGNGQGQWITNAMHYTSLLSSFMPTFVEYIVYTRHCWYKWSPSLKLPQVNSLSRPLWPWRALWPWPKPGNLLLMDSASPYWCLCPNPKLTAYFPCKDQQSYF